MFFFIIKVYFWKFGKFRKVEGIVSNFLFWYLKYLECFRSLFRVCYYDIEKLGKK